MTRLEDLIRNTDQKKKTARKRKLGNQKKVWTKETLSKATVYIDGDD